MPITPDKTMKIEIRTKPFISIYSVIFPSIIVELEDVTIFSLSIPLESAKEWLLKKVKEKYNIIHCSEGEDIELTPEKFLKSVHFTEKLQKELIEFSINKLITNK